jgi:hypothetical protein
MKKGSLTMSHRWTTGCVLALGSMLLVSVGCWQGGTKRVYPKEISSSASADAMQMYDTNKDGKISGDELAKCPALKAAMAQLDPSGKGEITADMIDARIKMWKDTKLARTTVGCRVTRNGKPFPGATVTFVPEKFLGPKVEAGTGKTDQTGNAMLSVPVEGRQPPGMGLGFYRVVITKEGMKIPEKYSTEANTVLGQEIARDAAGIGDQKGIKFDLKF